MTGFIRQSKSAGLLMSAGSYVLAFMGAVLAVQVCTPSHPLMTVAVGDIAATLVIFVISMTFNNSSMYDPYWSVKPAVIAGYYFITLPGAGLRGILVLILVLLYSLRLTSNFYRDWPGLGKEDFRYVSFRIKYPSLYWPVSFVAVHFFPTVMVWLGCLPLYAVFRSGSVPLGAFDAAGAIVLVGAVLLAFIADEQLRRFREDPGHQGKTISEGLWRFSRHPNYLGEILTWWGLFLFGLAGGLSWWWTGVGALGITLMFLFASIPLMETRLLESRPDYAAYRNRTPVLVPLPKKMHPSQATTDNSSVHEKEKPEDQ